jgi:hypothetical protein
MPPPVFDINVKVEELDESSVHAEEVEGVNIRLWPHQLALLHRCLMLENAKVPLKSFKSLEATASDEDFLQTQVGIIGDSVGSGKSYVVLSLIHQTRDHPVPTNESSIKAYGNNKVIMCFSERCRNVKTNLLVIPHNLVSQWSHYIKKFNSSLKYTIVSKFKHVEAIADGPPEDFVSNDIILVTASFYPNLGAYIASKGFKMRRVIFDEVDNMNLPSCMHIESRFYWFITASYGNLLSPRGFTTFMGHRTIWHAQGLRNSGFIKDLFVDLAQNLKLDMVKTLVVKTSDAYVKRSVMLPEIQNAYIKCQTPLIIHTLSGFVNREVIQSLNAGDVETAIRLINPNHVTSEANIIALQIEKLQRELHNTNVRIEFNQNLHYDDEEDKQQELNRLASKREEITQKIHGIQQRIKDADACCICYEDFKKRVVSPCCSNSYCFVCLNMWLARQESCPLCKQKLLPKDVMVVNDLDTDENALMMQNQHDCPEETQMNEAFDKMKNLEIMLRAHLDCPNRKIIIYSAYETTFGKVSDLLTKLDIKYNYLKGNDSQLNSIIRNYKTGNLKVLLANTRHYGSGLNLENTTDIVMFHKMDSMMEKQVIGRAQRYGRATPLKVWYLLYENEVGQI